MMTSLGEDLDQYLSQHGVKMLVSATIGFAVCALFVGVIGRKDPSDSGTNSGADEGYRYRSFLGDDI